MTYTPEDAARDANRARCRAWYAENREQQRARCRETAKRKRDIMQELIRENARLVCEVTECFAAIIAIRDECRRLSNRFFALGRERNTPYNIAMQQRGISATYCLEECEKQIAELRAKGITVENVDKPG